MNERRNWAMRQRGFERDSAVRKFVVGASRGSACDQCSGQSPTTSEGRVALTQTTGRPGTPGTPGTQGRLEGRAAAGRRPRALGHRTWLASSSIRLGLWGNGMELNWSELASGFDMRLQPRRALDRKVDLSLFKSAVETANACSCSAAPPPFYQCRSAWSSASAYPSYQRHSS